MRQFPGSQPNYRPAKGTLRGLDIPAEAVSSTDYITFACGVGVAPVDSTPGTDWFITFWLRSKQADDVFISFAFSWCVEDGLLTR